MSFVRTSSLCAIVATIALSACGSSSSSAPATTAAAATTTAAAAATSAAAATTAAPATTAAAATTAAPATAAAAATTAAAAATTAATTASDKPVGVQLATTSLGSVIVDDQGMTLYLFSKDTQGQPSVCTGKCLDAWPPLLATTGTPTVGAGLDASKLTIIPRADGGKQVAYNGWPLYYWVKDAKPGDTTGQKVGDVWFVLDAKGDKVAG
jgi:predicted lipoprotein with Yx(FWY)xxD motif